MKIYYYIIVFLFISCKKSVNEKEPNTQHDFVFSNNVKDNLARLDEKSIKDKSFSLWKGKMTIPSAKGLDKQSIEENEIAIASSDPDFTLDDFNDFEYPDPWEPPYFYGEYYFDEEWEPYYMNGHSKIYKWILARQVLYIWQIQCETKFFRCGSYATNCDVFSSVKHLNSSLLGLSSFISWEETNSECEISTAGLAAYDAVSGVLTFEFGSYRYNKYLSGGLYFLYSDIF